MKTKLGRPKLKPYKNLRKCIWCKESKDTSAFGKSTLNKEGINRRCKQCEAERGKKRYWSDPIKSRKVVKDNFQKHREKYIKKHKEREQNLKDQIFNYYGGYICACCKEEEKIFLTIDHINGGGTKHRKENHGGGRFTYRWIVKNNFPSSFQVLCMNCNFGKGQNGGICPHVT